MTQSNVTPTIPFDSDEVTLWVLNISFSKFIIKFDVISIQDE